MTYKQANEILISGGVLRDVDCNVYYKLDEDGNLRKYSQLSCDPSTEIWSPESLGSPLKYKDATEEHRCAYDKHICQKLSTDISAMLKQAGASLKHSFGGGTVVCIGSHESFIGPTTL